MPRASPLQPSLNAGEFGPRMAARTDFAKYPLGCETLENMIPIPQGGAMRRPGTVYVAEQKNSAEKCKMRPFEFNVEQAYALESGNGYFRFYRDNGQIVVDETDAAIANGTFTSNITDWDDRSTGGAGNQISHDSTNGRLTLETSGTAADDIGWAEQDVAVGASYDTVVHVLKFRVIGAPSDRVELRIGTSSTDNSIVDDVLFEVGYHCYPFTPGDGNNTIYIQFRNRGNFRDKDVQIDDVSLISDSAVEIDAPYAEADLFEIKQAQSTDTLFLAHPDYPTYKLTRGGHSTWSLVEVAFEDGPWLAQNETSTTLTAGAATGLAVTFTASATEGINGGQGFLSTDVGRLIRLTDSATLNWGWGVIVERTSTTAVKVDIRRTVTVTTAETTWRLGAWSGTTGYPSTVSFQEQRLAFAGSNEQPQTFWMSQSADFENMSPDSANSGNWDGTVEADDALDFTISADQVNVIRWLAPGRRMFIGTVGGEWAVSSVGAQLAPDDIDVKRQTTFGSANLSPVQMRGRMMFVQRAARKVMEFAFDFEQDNFQALDMTILANHVSKGGLVDLSYQQEPDSTLWCVRADGQCVTLTYQPDQNVVGWARQIAGGSFSSGDAVVESVTTIPVDGADQPWVSVKRTIDGATKRYIEYMAPAFETGDAAEDAVYVDSAVTYDGAATTSVTGADHLEGETVAILADGAVHPSKTVSGGAVTLDAAASVVQLGLPYTHTYKSLKWEAGSPIGTAQGQTKRIHGVTLMLLDAGGEITIGPDTSNLKTIAMRTVSDEMDTAVPLFTGEKFVEFDGNYGTDTRVLVQGSSPVPFVLLAVAPRLKTNPR